MSEQDVEQMVQKTNPSPNRLTPALIDACIVATQYYQFPNTTLMVCCLTLRNGYNVTGESAAVDPLNFSAEIGRKVSRERAREKIWSLEGYLLKESMGRLPRGEPSVTRAWDRPPGTPVQRVGGDRSGGPRGAHGDSEGQAE